jgi:hypothetical protein
MLLGRHPCRSDCEIERNRQVKDRKLNAFFDFVCSFDGNMALLLKQKTLIIEKNSQKETGLLTKQWAKSNDLSKNKLKARSIRQLFAAFCIF